MATPASTSYDQVPYESTSFPQTHPDRLATLGTLFGLEPAPVDGCRVLELGCAAGANLLPMAFHLPRSEFVGVDASGRQIAEARTAAEALGLGNVRLEHASILDVDADWGEFDYIVCHGVYSWVAAAVRDKILAIAAENLRPHGIAYVSYNTYPGWHLRGAIRSMMRYHAEQFPEVGERIEQARALLDFLATNVDAGYYGAALRSEVKLVRRVQDSYLFHEHLEEVNEPLYFHEFVGRAEGHGLRYLAEADFSTMLTSGFPAATAETLDRISLDMVHAEQYMDFLRNRFFRQTLLCHAGHELRRALTTASLEGLLLASPVVPDETAPDGVPGFLTPDGRRVATTFPLTRAALGVLGDHWPNALDQGTLRTMARDRLGTVPEAGTSEASWEVVMQDMLHCCSTGAAEMRTWPAPCVNRVSEKPEVSRLAAHQAPAGRLITNQRHEAVPLDVVGRCLAPILDGTLDRAALLSALMAAVARGDLNVESDGRHVTDEGAMESALASALDRTLDTFRRRALLVG